MNSKYLLYSNYIYGTGLWSSGKFISFIASINSIVLLLAMEPIKIESLPKRNSDTWLILFIYSCIITNIIDNHKIINAKKKEDHPMTMQT